jgi:hypothetical protein
MPNLDDATLDELRELNRLRDRAKDLRKRGLAALKALADEKEIEAKDSKIQNFDLSTMKWRSGPHPVDMALLVRVLNHRNIGDYNSNTPKHLQRILQDEIKIETLFPESTGDENSDPVPVLTAARVMNALMGRSETVFSRTSMICYYRIVRELYTARSPDWIIGAARGGPGGRASAFVTGECIRAILAFEKSIGDTITFLESTERLVEEFKKIEMIPEQVTYLDKVPEEHFHAGKEIQFEQLALDWYVTNNLRRNVIALDVSSVFPIGSDFKGPFREFIKKTLEDLPELLRRVTDNAFRGIEAALSEIKEFRAEEAGVLKISEIEKLISLASEPNNAERKESLSEHLVALVDKHETAVSRIAKARERNEETPEHRQIQQLLRQEFEAIFREEVIINEAARKKLKDRSSTVTSGDETDPDYDIQTLTWQIETNEGLIKLLDANLNSPASNSGPIRIGGDVLVNLNRLLLEYYFPKLRPSDTQRFNRTIHAHDTALKVVFDALHEAERACAKLKNARYENLSEILKILIVQFNGIRSKVHRVINPAKQYIQTVLHRELAQASNPARFDAGELLFAATCFGATTGWKPDEQLDEARRLLIDVLPSDGRMRSNRPVHSTPKGLTLIPISFEMTRSLAHLLQKDTRSDLDSKLVSKMLNIFEGPILIDAEQTGPIGWNFQSAPEQNKPNAWVSSVAVFALDRIVRMLNDRINAAIFKRFREERPTELGLGSLIYPDHELQPQLKPSGDPGYAETPPRFDKVAVGVRLQQMRAHLSRAVLPRLYSPQSSEKKHRRVFAAIFYGPPGTGKTTLAEALACTTHAPLIRLSPGDLMVQGTEVVESRARLIFESLSMLSQAVIVLDEFEPVIRRRDSGKTDPAEFRFLVTGMLPKLRTLNKAAKEQSLVYCLATNFLGEVDPAAKREERFDLHIPVYHPDPISRFETFFYQLICLAQNDENNDWMDQLKAQMRGDDFWLRVGHTISRTRNVSAQSLATDFFKIPKETPEETETLRAYIGRVLPNSFFHYVLDKTMKYCPEPSKELVEAKKSQRLTGDQGANRFRSAIQKLVKLSEEQSEYSTPVERDIKKQLEQFEEYWPKI